jgi:hypothetical protein
LGLISKLRNTSMEIKVHNVNGINIAELVADEVVINTTDDGLDLMGNLYYQGFDKILIHEENLTPDFFDLKNGIAGEILQKFSNYRVRLAIVGDFSKYTSKSVNDFIYESNKVKQIVFVGSVTDAIRILSS